MCLERDLVIANLFQQFIYFHKHLIGGTVSLYPLGFVCFSVSFVSKVPRRDRPFRVEAVAADELPVHQRTHVVHRRPLVDVERVLVGEPLDHPGGNPLDELLQHGIHCPRWFRRREPK